MAAIGNTVRKPDTSNSQFYDSWNEDPSLIRPELLHELYETQADAGPDRVAVEFGKQQLTYGDLDRRANRLARLIRAAGAGCGDVVAILLPRSLDVYVAMLAVLKAGAAYLPLDPEYPPERIAYILEDAGARLLVSESALAPRLFQDGRLHALQIDAQAKEIAKQSAERLSRSDTGADPCDLCYLIYTSGSTGRPKGVQIEHRSICHLVRAEGKIFGVTSTDRVYQGFSIAFDASLEEIWLAFFSGATLIAATPDMAHAGMDLPRMLRERRVTVLSCVPTLLEMMNEDIQSLRLLIVGGEACPPYLVRKWCRAGRRMFNTYGPTEATVIATYGELHPLRSVAIGRAVPNYRVVLLDERSRRVPPGAVGEIYVGGIGVARGYVGLSEQTRTRFVMDPFAPAGGADARLYRTGDLGRLTRNGEIEFLGRADAQVKLRGFRVELTEIESVLLQVDGVMAAACALREDVPGVQQLIGYVVSGAGGQVDESRIRSHLLVRLPAYMVPALIETVTQLPMLPNGKLDRASLPKPHPRNAVPEARARRRRSYTEHRITKVWERIFLPRSVSVDDDFFLDLGGHSLLAARMVSELRKNPQFAHLSVTDVYEHPTIASLAESLDAAAFRSQPWRTQAAARDGHRPRERGRHILAGVLQAVGLYVVFGFRAIEWVTPYLVYFLLVVAGYPVHESAAWAAASAIAVFPLLVLAAVAAKWLVLGRVRPGGYPLWGGYYLRWWFVQALVAGLRLDYLAGTPLLPFVYRLLGARVGRDVYLGTDRLAAFDLISIGEGASVDDDASLLGYAIENEELVVGPVTVGRRCYVGTRSALRAGALMEDGARLEDLSLLPSGGRIPRGETWAGSPARRVSRADAVAAPPQRGLLRRAAIVALYAGLVLVFPLLLLAAIVPGMALLVHIDLIARPLLYLGATPLVGASFVLLLTTEVVLLKWLLVGRVRAGRYPVHGGFYIRNWIVDRLLALSLDLVGPLRATLYLAPWYRALGARLGRFVELSTATSPTPDLLEIGDEGTIADEASLGAPHVEGGWMTVAPTRLGRRAFLGNSAVVPAGAAVGDGSLIGVLSICPADPAEAGRPSASWLGSPPILLPRRQPSAAFAEQRTFRPTRKLRLARGAFEILRVTLPPAGFIVVTATVLTAALELWDRVGLGVTLLLLPLVYAACCGLVIGAVALAKWTVLGRFRPFERPLWSLFVWRLELVNALYEFLATPLALEALQGTPLLPWYLRLLGARIGRGVYIHTTGFLEWDLVQVGDRVALNDDCVLQTHLFEDRVLKAARLHIGADCAVGADSVVLYDSRMEDGARLDALSLLMKGETLPARTGWAGIPARTCSNELPEGHEVTSAPTHTRQGYGASGQVRQVAEPPRSRSAAA